MARFIKFLIEKDTPVHREQLELLLCFINDTHAIKLREKDICGIVINITSPTLKSIAIR